METVTEQKIKLIMLIDDTFEDMYINNRMLEKHGKNYSIMKFNMGTIALEYLQAHQTEQELIPDIIFLDIHMPQMNAFEFLNEYNKLPELLKFKCKVYLLSSSFDTDDIEKANANPNVAHLYEKPIAKDVIEAVVNSVAVN